MEGGQNAQTLVPRQMVVSTMIKIPTVLRDLGRKEKLIPTGVVEKMTSRSDSDFPEGHRKLSWQGRLSQSI